MLGISEGGIGGRFLELGIVSHKFCGVEIFSHYVPFDRGNYLKKKI